MASLLILAGASPAATARAHDVQDVPLVSERWAEWSALGGSEEVGLLVPTLWSNVEPLVAPEQHQRILRLGVGPETRVVLAMTFTGTPRSVVSSPLGTFTTDQRIIEVILGVGLYVGAEPSDLTRFQFYTLRSYVNWAPLHDAWAHVGLPVELVGGMTHVVQRDPLTGLGTFSVDIPAPDGRVTLTGQMVLPLLIAFSPVEAANYYAGEHGVVRVHHDSEEAIGLTPSSQLVAAPGSLAAGILGATSVWGSGVFLKNHPLHHLHRAAVLPP